MLIDRCMSKMWDNYKAVIVVAIMSLTLNFLLKASDEVEANMVDDGRSMAEMALALDFEKMKLNLHDQGVKDDRLREALATWYERNRGQVDRLQGASRRARADKHERMKQDGLLDMPAVDPPVKGDFSRDDFISKADGYMNRCCMALAAQADAEGREARDLVAAWMEKPQVARMYADLEGAKKKRNEEERQRVELAQLKQQEADLARPFDLNKFEGEERLLEEMHRKVLELVAVGPLAEGEEIRDRLGPAQAFFDERFRQLSAMKAEKARRVMQDRVRHLEARLAEGK